jgi:hypothetical protein
MLIDLVFFGIPLIIGTCFVGLALRDKDPRFWPPALSILAFCLFYIAGGREVVLYLSASLMVCSMFL